VQNGQKVALHPSIGRVAGGMVCNILIPDGKESS
jgi:hypothetical protein